MIHSTRGAEAQIRTGKSFKTSGSHANGLFILPFTKCLTFGGAEIWGMFLGNAAFRMLPS